MSVSSDRGSGLHSKVAQRVGLSPVDEVDNKPVAAHQPEGAKLALKQMIERKQYNDAVRRREFDKLRRLRLNPCRPRGRDRALVGFPGQLGVLGL